MDMNVVRVKGSPSTEVVQDWRLGMTPMSRKRTSTGMLLVLTAAVLLVAIAVPSGPAGAWGDTPTPVPTQPDDAGGGYSGTTSNSGVNHGAVVAQTGIPCIALQALWSTPAGRQIINSRMAGTTIKRKLKTIHVLEILNLIVHTDGLGDTNCQDTLIRQHVLVERPLRRDSEGEILVRGDLTMTVLQYADGTTAVESCFRDIETIEVDLTNLLGFGEWFWTLFNVDDRCDTSPI